MIFHDLKLRLSVITIILSATFLGFFQNCSKVQFLDLEKTNYEFLQNDQIINQIKEDNAFADILTQPDVIQYEFLMYDSFERQSAFEGPADGFGWQGFVEDNGNPIYADNNEINVENNIDAAIYPEEKMGKVFDRDRALFLTGREGSSLHKIHLITRPIDLNKFDEVVIRFKQLLINLESSKYGGMETLKLEICRGLPETCGVLEDGSFDPLNIEFGTWYDIYDAIRDKDKCTSELRIANDVPSSSFTTASEEGINLQLHGKDQDLSDWQECEVKVDLNIVSKATRDQFMFRFTVVIDEGFAGDDTDKFNNLLDGVALDLVAAVAIEKK